MSHYYNRYTGDLYDRVANKSKPGEYRDFTLRDARPLNALPSVTTLLTLLSKPGLVSWQMGQVALAAWNGSKGAEHPDNWDEKENYIEYCVTASQEYVHRTADFGTAVHAWVHAKLTGKPMLFPPLVPKSEEAADYLVEWLPANGFEITETEHHFVNAQLGWGGTCDFIGTHYGDPFIGDLKTQSDPLSFYDPEHPLQLAGYSLGLGLIPDIKRISIILNRDEFAVKHKVWGDNSRYDEAFMGLAQLWMLLNKYDPREAE